MAARKDLAAWTPDDIDRLRRLTAEGVHVQVIAKTLGRSLTSVRQARGRNKIKVPKVNPLAIANGSARPLATEQEIETKTTHDGIEARSNGLKIKTVEDLLVHIEADMDRFEIVSSEATKWEVVTKDADDKPVVTPAFRVFVRLRPKAGPTTEERIAAVLEAAFKERRPPIVRRHLRRRAERMQALVIADPHFGKYSWYRTTGHNYDLDIARRVLGEATEFLLSHGEREGVTHRYILLLGDQFHTDTPQGTTTSGTVLDRDGRMQKMIEVGADALVRAVDRSAAALPTTVVLIPGNHDRAMSWAFQRILQERYRRDARVTVDGGYTGRKYLTWERNLIGIAHGDETTKTLPQLMAIEAAEQWGKAAYREIHKGHIHQRRSELQKPTLDTVDGVLVRTHPALCPPDDWHVANGYVGPVRAMETYYYVAGGGLDGMKSWSPDVAKTVRRAA